MRISYFLVLFISLAARAQDQPIEIVIDSIVTNKSVPGERKFTIHYHLKNLTDKPISFYLATKNLVPIGAGSMNPRPYFKLFEANNSIDVNTIFETEPDHVYTAESIEKLVGKKFSEINEDEITQFFAERKTQMLLESLVRMKPHETKLLCADISWNLKRYYTNDVYEYYLNETMPHSFELSVHLMKEHFKNQFTPEQFATLFPDDTFVKGWYTSNKMAIDLRP